jgi:phosphate-selective porin OprO/OprP
MKSIISKWRSWTAIVVGFVAVTLGGFRNTAWSEDQPPPSVKISLELPSDVTLKVHALIQTDGRFYTGDAASGQTDTFLLRRARPILEGTLFKFYDFLLVPDFGGGTTAIYDAYLDIRPWTYAKLRAGKFKPPIGLERLQSDSTLTFAERGLTSNLIPQRDIGAQFFGDVLQGALTYQASLTNGAADAALPDTDTNDGKEGALRVFAQPFKNSSLDGLKGLGLGLAGTYAGDHTTLASYKTASGQTTFFSYGATTVADGQRTHLVPQANYYRRSLGLFGEYVQSSQVVRQSTIKTRLTNEAWQGAASYVLTGENASYQGVVPSHPFDPQTGTWGAFELAARFHQLLIDPDTFDLGYANIAANPRKATAYAVGLNWYLNKFIKIIADYEQTWFDGGGGNTTGDRPIERVVLTRWQLAF